MAGDSSEQAEMGREMGCIHAQTEDWDRNR